MCAYFHMNKGTLGSPKLDPQELQLQIVVSHLTWILGTELRSSERAASVLNGRTISPATFT